MPPAIIGGAIAAAGTVGGAALANKGASQAAKATQAAADQQTALQREIYGQNKETLTPFVNAAGPATDTINGLLDIGGDRNQASQRFQAFLNNSDYAFNFGRGANDVMSGYAGAGTLQSGAAMKGLEQFRQGLQSSYRGQYLNALQGQQGVGLTAASSLAGVGQNYANSLGNIYQQQGDNLANAALLKAQNTGNAVNSLANIGGSILGQGNLFGSPSSSGANLNNILVTRGGRFF